MRTKEELTNEIIKLLEANCKKYGRDGDETANAIMRVTEEEKEVFINNTDDVFFTWEIEEDSAEHYISAYCSANDLEVNDLIKQFGEPKERKLNYKGHEMIVKCFGDENCFDGDYCYNYIITDNGDIKKAFFSEDEEGNINLNEPFLID
jgi:hypothetical protein